ncbi:MAG TPA: DUF418 domain-containing protein [Asticcacaulis sp.]|nr:DUF418 domain-containing protein [Asticcacaulis sp.]
MAGGGTDEDGRILCLDHIRGLSVLGILIVNAIAFAQPIEVYNNPALSPVPLSHADIAWWWLIEVFCREKFVTLFTLLFGISLYLVGRNSEGEGRVFGTPLFRRLAWLALFGVIHGALIWNGDILLLYAVTGFLMWRWQTAKADALIGWGLFLFLVGAAVVLLPAMGLGVDDLPVAADVGPQIDLMRQGFAGSLSGNFLAWVDSLLGTFCFVPGTLGGMMLGLGLFKAGLLRGEGKTGTYVLLILAGAVSLVAIALQASQETAGRFQGPEIYGVDQIANTVLCLPVALGYASLLILAGRTGVGRVLLHPLACCGRMAFTNYLTQSLLMTALCYGGRAPENLAQAWNLPWFGLVNDAGLVPVVAAIWLGQLTISTLWLSVFRYGPFEWLWRCLTYNRLVAITR